MPELPEDLAEAFSDGGQPTLEQVRRMLELEALALGLTLDEALRAANEGTLPYTAVGIDFRNLAQELQNSAA